MMNETGGVERREKGKTHVGLLFVGLWRVIYPKVEGLSLNSTGWRYRAQVTHTGTFVMLLPAGYSAVRASKRSYLAARISLTCKA